jgi:hypothetical protein
MLQEPFVFLGILVLSSLLTSLVFSDRAGVIRRIANYLFFIGVIFHEIAHATMILAGGRIPKGINVWWRDSRNQANPHGSVEPDHNYSFLHTVLIAFAPLYFSTWLIFYLWFGVVNTPFYDPVIKTLAVVIIISLLLTAAPSGPDLRFIPLMFSRDPKHSWYQILLIFLSIFILWIFLVITQVSFFLDVFYYIAVAVIYFILRFSFIVFRKIGIKINSYYYKKPEKVSARKFTRRRYKPAKP